MYAIKVLLSTTALACVACALLLLWNESRVTCGYLTCKVFETMFIIVSLVLTREVSRCDVK